MSTKARATISVRVSPKLYEKMQEVMQDGRFTQAEAMDYLYFDIVSTTARLQTKVEELEKENERVRKEVEKWRQEVQKI